MQGIRTCSQKILWCKCYTAIGAGAAAAKIVAKLVVIGRWRAGSRKGQIRTLCPVRRRTAVNTCQASGGS